MDEFNKGELRKDKAAIASEIYRGAYSTCQKEYSRCYWFSWKDFDSQ